MLLRTTLESVLPLKDDERKLSTNAAKVVFRGSYIWPNYIMGLSVRRNYDDSSFAVGVVRSTGKMRPGIMESWTVGEEHSSSTFNNSPAYLVEEVKNPAALNRASRVENIARKIKLTALAVTLAASGILVGISESNTSATHEHGVPTIVPNDNHRVGESLDV
jgi:hypothetical protein